MMRAALRSRQASFGGIVRRIAKARTMAGEAAPKPTVLCILDGWGYRETTSDNAVAQGHTPTYDSLFGIHCQRGQVSFLDACEREVGLPMGQIGNSEVGHMNIGAGRIVFQDICRIDDSIADGSIQKEEAFVNHVAALKKSGGTAHVLGLVSPGGVHSMQSHVAELANALHREGLPVVIHAFTDGRDVPPKDAAATFEEFESSLDDGIIIGTLTGRYYAMDRDNRWERVGLAYDVMVSGKGQAADVPSAGEAIQQGYADDLSDEFILPTKIGDYAGMKDGDGLLMCNFRADRAREILDALASPNPSGELQIGGEGGRSGQPKFSDICGLVEYSTQHNEFMSTILTPKDIPNTLGEVVAKAGLKQLRAAETEKYPHVTFFLNGGLEEPFPGEDRLLVPSPKVATYDLQPEMSAPELSSKLCEAVQSGKHDLVVINFANPDMVGHSGSLSAAIAAVEAVDECLGNLVTSVQDQQGAIIVTADHGNCEKMREEATGEPHTAHTLNKVAAILADYSPGGDLRKVRSGGRLADLAPTVLELMGLAQPEEMTGSSLLLKEVDSLPDGPAFTRPPREGSAAAGSVPGNA
eukprot:g3519.t1